MVLCGEELATALSLQLRECRFCPRDCGVDRLGGELGYCGVGIRSRYFAEFVHFGEEQELVPAYAIFFTGCNLRCGFCINYDVVVAPQRGVEAEPDYFRRRITEHARHGVKWVSFIGGEPTCHLHTIAEILTGFDSPLPVVWNSNFYFSPAVRPSIVALTDLFLADLKFGNDACAEQLAGAKRYLEVVGGNLLAVSQQRELIVRHLLLPGHQECCTVPVLD